MRERVLVDPVTMYQPASSFVEKQSVYCDSRHVRTKDSVPDVPGHSPWGKQLSNVRHDFQRRSPMFRRQILQAGTSRPLPHRAPFDGAAPLLAQLQMAGYHVGVQGHVHSGITDATKTRSIVAQWSLVRSFRGVSAETPHPTPGVVRC